MFSKIKKQFAQRPTAIAIEWALVTTVVAVIAVMSVSASDASIGSVYGAITDPLANVANGLPN